jgi:hypothetical protein
MTRAGSLTFAKDEPISHSARVLKKGPDEGKPPEPHWGKNARGLFC